MQFVLVLLAFIFGKGYAVLGENAILERPTVECTEDAILFSINTAGPFRGSIYVKGQHELEPCRQIFYSNDINHATFSVRIGECGMRRIRLLQPHGISYNLVFVTTFHPQFMTKLDRAFNVRCFYAHADKMVHANMDVSAIPTESIEESTTILPSCHYSIRDGAVDGQRVRQTEIGTTLVHRWECDNPRFGMLVRNCFVTDGAGLSIKVLDERGCPIPLSVSTSQLVYDSSLNLAYTVIEAFNFPDRTSLQFNCQIAVCSKRDNECLGVTPPNCPRVTRTDFRPNSIVDSEINPTQVVATFQGAVRSNNIGETLIDGTLTPTGINDNRIPIGSMMPPDELEVHPWRREQNRIDDDGDETRESLGDDNQKREASDPQINSTNTEQFDSIVEKSAWTIPTQPTDVYLRDQPPLEIFVRSTTPAARISTTTTIGDVRLRRLADQVMDVESEPIFVRPVDDFSQPQAVNSPSDDISESFTCLNKTAVFAMAGAFALTTLLSLIFITYMWSSLYKTCGKERDNLEQQCNQSTRSSLSNSSADIPIYTRRLGNSNYVLPVRHFH